MADVTTKPVQIDTLNPANPNDLAGTGVCAEGPFKTASGNLYCVLLPGNAPVTINVFKSADGGATWTQQDIANSPTSVPGSILWCQFDSAGNGVIRFVYAKTIGNPATIGFAKFDCGTNLFTPTIFPDLADADLNAGLPGAPFVVRSDGTVLLVYQTLDGNIGFRVNTAGVWGAFTVILNVAAHTYNVGGAYLDSATGTAHVVFGDRTGGVTTWFHLTITLANAVSAADSIAVATASDVLGLGLISGGSLYIPLARGAGNSKATIFSSPLSPPAWTITDLDVQLTNNIVTVGVGLADGVVTALWNFENNAGTINVIRKSLLSGGAWGAFTVYYDVNALPPNSVSLNNQFVSQVCVFGGSLGALVTMLAPGLSFAAFFMIAGVAGGGVLTLKFGGTKVFG